MKFVAIVLALSFVACLDDPSVPDIQEPDAQVSFEEEVVDKDSYDVIAACLLVCFSKWGEMCPAMDTEAEYQVCADWCINEVPPTVPAACEDEYSAFQHCRSDRLDSYYCRNGEAVSRWSCLTQQIALGFCRQQNGVTSSKLLDDEQSFQTPDCGLQPWDPRCSGDNGSGGSTGGGGAVPGHGTGGDNRNRRLGPCPNPAHVRYPSDLCGPPPGTICDPSSNECRINDDGWCMCPGDPPIDD